jgi:leader peptidase (prepilin peptidase) / N-methyltransferase
MLASDVAPWAVRALAIAFGGVWGSFFNVAIHRWPRGISVVTPASHCPQCGAPIPPWRNVPVFGWLALRGRAACCGAPISPRYPLVELMGVALCVALAEVLIVRSGPDVALGDAVLETLAYFVFAGALVIATFVDLEWMQIPDEVSLPGTAVGLVTVPLRGAPGALDAAVGAGLGFLLVQMVFVWAYERLTGRRGMGEGDAKLLMMIGAFLGWRGVLFSLVAGSVQGLVVAVGARLTGRRIGPTASMDSVAFEERLEADDGALAEAAAPDEADGPISRMKLPFGPLLALGALQYLFFGERLVAAYLGLFSP